MIESELQEISNTIKCKLTKKQAQFLEEYVSVISKEVDEEIIEYKKDFVMTEKHEKMIRGLHSMFSQKVYEFWKSENLINYAKEFYWVELDSVELLDFYEGDGEYRIENFTITKKYNKFYVDLYVSCIISVTFY